MNKLKLMHFILLSIFLSIPVILLNSYYADDLYRSSLATYGWESDGRLLSLVLYYIFGLGGSLSDLYPFNQMAAYALLGLTTYIIASSIVEDKTIIGLAITLPILTSPLLLGNLLYRFDSLTMMAGVACAALPYSFNATKKRVLFVLSPLLLLASLSFYQASSIAFVSLAAMEFFKSTVKGQSLSKSLIMISVRAISLCAGFVGFKVLNYFFVIKNDYTEQLSKLVSINSGTPDKIFDTFTKSMDLVMMFSVGGIGKVICIFLTGVFLSSLIIVFRIYRNSGIKLALKSSIGIYLPLLISFLCIPGFILLANTPVFYPRLYIGFGFFFAFGSYVIYLAVKSKKIIPLLFVIPIAFTSINLTTINAIKNQDHNNDFFSQDLKNDIYNNIGLDKFNDITFYGEIKRPDSVSHAIEKYPFISWIIGTNFHWSYDIGRWVLKRNGITVNYSTPDIAASVIKQHSSEKPVAIRQSYDLYLIDRHIVVAFK